MLPRKIQSLQNPNFKKWNSLLVSHGIQKENKCILSGEKIIKEILVNRPHLISEVLICKNNHIDFLKYLGETICYDLSLELFKKLDIFNSKAPLVIARLPEIKPMQWNHSPEGLEVVCPLGDPLNLGALIRSCQAFEVSKIILLSESANPFHPKTVRASSGTVLTAPLYSSGSISSLSHLFALDSEGESITSFQWPQKARLLIGEEGQGLPHENFQKISIPISKTVNSLNAAMSLGIALFHYRLQHPSNL